MLKAVGLAIIMVCATAVGADTSGGSGAPNLCANPSFEQVGADGFATGWTREAPTYTLVSSPVHSGGHSLQIVNTDAGKYALCTQPVKLEPGRFYELSGWVKTQGVGGGDGQGASFCVEWWGPKGYLGGCYPGGANGDSDWTHIRAVSDRVPAGATSARIVCYLWRNVTGTAWFDDVELHQGRQRPLTSYLISPGYRGLVFAGGPMQVMARAQLYFGEADYRARDVILRTELIAADGNAVFRRDYRVAGDGTIAVTLPASALPPGKGTARLALISRKDGRHLEADEYPLTRLGDGEPRPRAYIDDHRRLVADGKPFFPLGVYWYGISEKELVIYADGPFNCLMDYAIPSREQLDLVQRYGLKLICSLKDVYYGTPGCPAGVKTEADEKAFVTQKVDELKSHPALLAWYVNDEMPVLMAPRLNAHQSWIAGHDPDHPTWAVTCFLGDIGKLMDSYDVAGTDPYPVPVSPMSWPAAWTAAARQQVRGVRALWSVPQIMNLGCYDPDKPGQEPYRPPTLAEMRSMAWQCICEGATGLIFYSWFDIRRDKKVPFDTQWPLCKRMAEEIKRYTPVLLSADAAPKVAVSGGGWLHTLVRSYEGRTYVFAVNDGTSDGDARFSVTGAKKPIRVRDEYRTIKPDHGNFTDHFDKLALHMYEVVP